MFRDPARYYNPDSNYNKYFNNKQFVNLLLNTIAAKLKRPISKNEGSYIINHLQNVNPTLFNMSKEKVFEVLVNDIVTKIITQPVAPDKIDIHETLKGQIGLPSDDTSSGSNSLGSQITAQFGNSVSIGSILGTTSLNDIKSLFGNNSQSKLANILMDTRWRTLDTDGTTLIRWAFQGNASTAQGTTNSLFDIQNITSMRVKEIRMPYVASADNQYKRISMYIQDFASQSIVAQENTNYHFMFHTQVDGRWINLTLPRDVDGIFRFRNPISSINNLNISFGSPLESIALDFDRMNLLVTSYGSVTTLTSTSPHNLQSGDLVYLSNFTTANPIYYVNIISQVNAKNGITQIQYVDDFNFNIPVDSSALLFTGAGTVATTDTSAVIIGTGTTFATTFNVNDYIQILGNRYQIVLITSDTILTIADPFVGTNAGLPYQKNNTINPLTVNAYFGAKRMFIEMEFEYF
jgi:hypothetical protein